MMTSTSQKILFVTFVLLSVAALLFAALATEGFESTTYHLEHCFITIESTDGGEHEFYCEGDSIYLIANIEVTAEPAAETDLGSIHGVGSFDITWQMSPDCESWSTIGTGERLELVLNAETASSYFRFIATWK